MGFISAVATIVALAVAGAIAYAVYATVMSVMHSTKGYLEQKNITLSRTGARVEVKEVPYEGIADAVQRGVVGIWNTSETKGFKPSFWNRRRSNAGEARKIKLRRSKDFDSEPSFVFS